jgi:hypothetical protein
MTTKTRHKRPKADAVQAATGEGVLDPRVLALNPARWPAWARARYGVDQPTGELVEPLTVEEAR